MIFDVPFSGMVGLPKGIGIIDDEIAHKAPSNSWVPRTRHSKRDGKKHAPSRKEIHLEPTEDIEGMSSKRQKSISKWKTFHGANQFGVLASKFISDEDLTKWKHKDPEEANAATMKAATEILLAFIDYKSTRDREKAHFYALEFKK